MYTRDELARALDMLGQVLQDRGLTYELAVIGGGALAMIGLIDRSTTDLGVVAVVHAGSIDSAEPLRPQTIGLVASITGISKHSNPPRPSSFKLRRGREPTILHRASA